MQNVNLYQEQFRPKRIAWPIQRFMVLGAVAMFCLVGWYAMERQRLNTLQATQQKYQQQLALWDSRMAQLETQLAKLESPDQQQLIAELRDELRGSRELSRYFETAVTGNGPVFSEYLDALARRHQRGMWLTDIQILRGGQKLRFGGSALNAKTVPDFLLALSSELAYAGRTFSSMLVNREPDADWKVDFVLSTSRDKTGS
ncbi:MAG: hypothetical protein OET44_04600 [Gammaproteobacteria bacterium]|nr:hypothetical protein [Gammaproteobacteria bacterium]